MDVIPLYGNDTGTTWGSAYNSGYPVASKGAGESLDAEILQRKIGNESAAKEAVKAELATLKRVVELHLRQLTALTREGSWESAGPRVQRAVRVFDDDVRDRTRMSSLDETFEGNATVPPSGESSRSYDFLRDTLVQNQRRCSTLNEDMMRVADANEELMNTMNSVKNTNMRLVEQIQQQTEEIARITQLRLADEEKMESLSRKHRSETNQWKLETTRQCEDVQRSAERVYDESRGRLVSKLRAVQEALKAVSGQVGNLRRSQVQSRAEMKATVETWSSGNLRPFSRKAVESLEMRQRADADAMVLLQDKAHSLRAQMDAVRDVREQEGASWSTRISTITCENEDYGAEMSRSVSQYQSKLAKVEEDRDRESCAEEDERRLMHDRVREMAMQVASMNAMLCESRGSAQTLEAKFAASASERQRLDDEMLALRTQIRESDEALDRAVRNNEQLRKQMEAQRVEAQNISEKELQDSQDQFASKLSQMCNIEREEETQVKDKVEQLEKRTVELATDVGRARQKVSVASSERSMLHRENVIWKSQMELAVRQQGELERERSEAQSDWDRTHSEMQLRNDEGQSRVDALLAEKQDLVQQNEDLRREASTKASQSEAYLEQLQRKSSEVEGFFKETKEALKERAIALARVRTEHQSQQSQMLERRSELEKELQRCVECFLADKELLENEMLRQKAQSKELMDEYVSLRMGQESSLHEAHHEPAQRIGKLDQALQELTERHRAELHHHGLKRDSYSKQSDNLEAELKRVQDQLNDNEKTLEVETAAMKAARANNMALKTSSSEDKTTAVAKLERAKATNEALSKKIEDVLKQDNQVRSQLQKELEDVRRDTQQKVLAAETRAKDLSAEYDAALKGKEATFKSDLDRERNRLETIMRENERLRRFIGEHRNASQHVTDIGQSMQEQLSKMQSRTDQLREELRRSGGS